MLVYCGGCSEIAGQEVKHLPPACVYDRGRPVQPFLPRMVPPDKVMDLLRERLKVPLTPPEQDMIDRLHSVLEAFLQEHFPADVRQSRDLIEAAVAVLRRLMTVEAAKGADWNRLNELGRVVNKLALFYRAYYQKEIEAGRHQGMDAADVAVMYMLVERDFRQRGIWGRLKYALWGI